MLNQNPPLLWTRRSFLRAAAIAGAGMGTGLAACSSPLPPYLGDGGPAAWIAEQVTGRVTDRSGELGIPGARIWFRAAFDKPPQGPGYVTLGGTDSGSDGRYEMLAKDQNGFEPKNVLWPVLRRPQTTVPQVSEVFRINRNITM